MISEEFSPDPKTIPKTSTISARVDIRDIATIARIFSLNGIVFRTKSDLINISLKTFAEIIADQRQKQDGRDWLFRSTTESFDYLDSDPRFRHINFAKTDRRRSFMKQLIAEKDVPLSEEQERIAKRAEELAESLKS